MGKYRFKVWIDGMYYHDDMEYDVEIELSEDEVTTIKKLVSEYDNDLSQGIMPVLEEGNDALYNKFYRAIFPEVFMELFSRDDMFEPVPGDEGKHWTIDDFDYLNETYGEEYDFDGAYIVSIPDQMMPPKMHLSKGMGKDEILRYIRRWNSMRNDIYGDISCMHDITTADEDALNDLIEKRLLALAEEVIEQNEEATLAQDDFDPFNSKYASSSFDLANEIYEVFKNVMKE